MPIIPENDVKLETLRLIAQKMLIAARTAPKGKGISTMEGAIVEGEALAQLADGMERMGEHYTLSGFIRDAKNVRAASILVLLGTRIAPLGLKKCGMCGFTNCDEKLKHPSVPCVMNTGDLGIAIGSAVSVAMDNRVDNRIMYSVGQVAMEMGLLGEGIKICYGIPLSATSKSPFFDR